MKHQGTFTLALSLIFVLFTAFLCNFTNNRSALLQSDSSNNFKNFIAKFELLSLPYIANTGCYEPDPSTSVPLDMDTDSVFIKYIGPAVTVGMLPDTAKFYAIIYCTAAACYMPVLAVYSKNGLLIDKKEISRGCGAGVGYTCSEVLRINSIIDISVVYTQEYSEVDNFGNIINGTNKKKIDTYKYSIRNDGIINVNVLHNTR